MAVIPSDTSGSYADALARAQNAYDRATTNIKTQRQQLLDRYGLNPNGTINSSSPYDLRSRLTNQYNNQISDYNLQGTRLGQDYNLGNTRRQEDYGRDTGLLDQQQGYLTSDYGTGNTRRQEDYNRDTGLLDQQQGYLTTDYNTGNTRRQSDYTRDSGRLGEDHTQNLTDIQTGMDRTQENSGLAGRFNADGSVAGLDLNGSAFGGFQRMLTQEGGQLDAARSDAINRGLGTHGAGAKGEAMLQAMFGGDRNDFRTQVRNSLMDSVRDRNLENRNYGRSSADMLQGFNRGNEDASTFYNRDLTGIGNQRSDLLTGFNRGNTDATTGYNRDLAGIGNQRSDLLTSLTRGNTDASTDYNRGMTDLDTGKSRSDYNYGVGQTDLYGNLTSGLGSLDNAQYQAGVDQQNAGQDAYMTDILTRIANGDFPATSPRAGVVTNPTSSATSGGGSTGGGSTYTAPAPSTPTSSAGVAAASQQAHEAAVQSGASPAEAALAARSAALNVMYGINPAPAMNVGGIQTAGTKRKLASLPTY